MLHGQVCPSAAMAVTINFFFSETTAAGKLKLGKHPPTYEDTLICFRHSGPIVRRATAPGAIFVGSMPGKEPL